mmetsp:Transcript_12040/g.17651  ORF Transcript_12040/g.17651 Transcript_12040/m.17651 type:complete len:140 (-) Transcript_12040:712-1131(-)
MLVVVAAAGVDTSHIPLPPRRVVLGEFHTIGWRVQENRQRDCGCLANASTLDHCVPFPQCPQDLVRAIPTRWTDIPFRFPRRDSRSIANRDPCRLHNNASRISFRIQVVCACEYNIPERTTEEHRIRRKKSKCKIEGLA